jgi:hypothetical protein
MSSKIFVINKAGREAEIAQLMHALPDLQAIDQDALQSLDETMIVLADVDSFIQHSWANPTIVLAHSHQGDLLAKAWQKGALAGWIWNQLPAHPQEVFKQLDSQYKRNQDSRDLPSAARLQQRLLPKPLALDDYRIEYFFQPAAFLSGDWFDYWRVDEHKLLFYLADVSGHGVTSSLLTSWMAAFHGRAESPTQLVNKLNHMLVAQNADKHITLLCGLLDQQTHTVEWCSAGHYPPAILLEPEQQPVILTTSSFPLGLTSDLVISTKTLNMSPQARLIFCSDGALESFQGGLNEQLEQLVKNLTNQQFSPPEHVADDIAFLCLSRK